MSKQKILGLILVLIAIALTGSVYLIDKRSIQEEEAQTTNSKNWLTYVNSIHGYTFQYPDNFTVNDSEDGETPTPNGTYHVSLRKINSTDTFPDFTIDVLHTPEWTTLGDGYNTADIFKNAFKTGGIKKVAELSREMNIKDQESPNKMVTDLKELSYSNGSGYGFTVADSFLSGFTENDSSGEFYTFSPPWDKFNQGPYTVVYFTDGAKVFRAKFLANEIGQEIFSTIKFSSN